VLRAYREAMPSSALLADVKSRRTRAILARHAKQLRHIFAVYAAADISSTQAREAADSVNMQELLVMVRVL
jgi:3-keto-L-gulonate-6-phosphate decarboxylase